MSQDPKKQQQVQISLPENIRGGVYSNSLMIVHTKEEFILDFMMISPQTGGAVTSRVILSPGHMKRVLEALKDNIGKYESQFGTVEPAIDPTKQNIH